MILEFTHGSDKHTVNISDISSVQTESNYGTTIVRYKQGGSLTLYGLQFYDQISKALSTRPTNEKSDER